MYLVSTYDVLKTRRAANDSKGFENLTQSVQTADAQVAPKPYRFQLIRQMNSLEFFDEVVMNFVSI